MMNKWIIEYYHIGWGKNMVMSFMAHKEVIQGILKSFAKIMGYPVMGVRQVD